MASEARNNRRILVGSVGLSAAGDLLAFIPLASIIAAETASAFAVVALLVALWAPSIVLAPLAGRLADRTETVALLRRTALLQAAVALTMGFAIDSIPALIALATVLGCGHAVAQTAEFALVPSVAGGSELARLNGTVETARYIGMTLGPVAGGALAAAGAEGLALGGNALSFLAVAVAVSRLSVRRGPQESSARGRPADARGGFSLLFAGDLRLVLGVAIGSLVLMTTVWAAEPFFARDDLAAGDFGYGVLTASWTVGMALGASLLAPRIRGAALPTAALLAIVGQGAGLALPALWLSFPFACVMFACGGASHGIKNVSLRTLIQTRVPSEAHGRAAAAYNAARNAAELLALVAGGALVTVLGSRLTLALSGILPAIAAVCGLAVMAAFYRRSPRATVSFEPSRGRFHSPRM